MMRRTVQSFLNRGFQQQVSRNALPSTTSFQMNKRFYALEKQLKLTFTSPTDALVVNEDVDSVTIPGSSGYMGVFADHVPTVSHLKPGVVTVHYGDGRDDLKLFVSSGFAFINDDSSCTLNAIEAVPVDQIDGALASQGFDEWQNKHAAATTDEDKAEAMLGVEFYRALVAASQE